MQKPPFKLDISGSRRRHGDAEKYIIYVLWLKGFSLRDIAKVLGFRTKQVSGIVGKSDYQNRAAMTDIDRITHLQELKAIRFEDGVSLDGGRLDRLGWDLLPLSKTQLRGPVRRKMR